MTPSEDEEEEEVDEAEEAAGEGDQAAEGVGDEANNEGAPTAGDDTRTEEEMLFEASGKRRAALASAAATSTSYTGKASERFRARSPPATATNGAGGSKKRAAEADEPEERVLTGEPCPEDFFDDDDAKTYLAGLAQKHFAAQQAPKEGEVVVGFLYRCRTKGEYACGGVWALRADGLTTARSLP